jgi:hypothetical protein
MKQYLLFLDIAAGQGKLERLPPKSEQSPE